jgi:hypothetical protein
MQQETIKIDKNLKVTKIRAYLICNIFPDEKNGILFCSDGSGAFMVSLNTGEKIGVLKNYSNTIHVLLNDERTRIILKNTVGQFSIYDYNNLQEPAWRFRLKKIDNTDGDFFIFNGKLYGKATADTDIGGKYYKISVADSRYQVCDICFVIDFINQSITCSKEEYGKAAPLASELRLKKAIFEIPQTKSYLDNAHYYYENEKFIFIDCVVELLVVHKIQIETNTKPRADIFDDEGENFIIKNGLTKDALEQLTAEEILHGGYFWALDSIENKAKAAGIGLRDFIGNEQITDTENALYAVGWFETELDEGGIDQYFSNGEQFEFDFLIKALTLIGANETVKVIQKGIKLKAGFEKKADPTESDYEKLSEKFEALENELTEDYKGLTIRYLKNKLLQNEQ